MMRPRHGGALSAQKGIRNKSPWNPRIRQMLETFSRDRGDCVGPNVWVHVAPIAPITAFIDVPAAPRLGQARLRRACRGWSLRNYTSIHHSIAFDIDHWPVGITQRRSTVRTVPGTMSSANSVLPARAVYDPTGNQKEVS